MRTAAVAISPGEGWSARGQWCLLRGRVCFRGGAGGGGIPACTEADPLPTVDRHTPVKI